MALEDPNKPTGGRCPVCNAPAVARHRPFCSARCGEIDLGRWLTGGYVIAGGSSDADEDGDDRAAETGHSGPSPDRDERS